MMSGVYPLAFVLGVLGSLIWLGFVDAQQPREVGGTSHLPPITRMDGGLAALAGGLLGARAGFALLHFDYFADNPNEILAFRQGGLSWVGAAVGAICGLAIYGRLSRVPFWPLADSVARPAPLLAMFLWLGCLLDHCSYGLRVEPAWWAPQVSDMIGIVAARWPTQALGALLSLVAFVLLLALGRLPLGSGAQACASLALLALISAALSLTRGDPTWMVANARIDTLAGAATLLLALTGLALRSRAG